MRNQQASSKLTDY